MRPTLADTAAGISAGGFVIAGFTLNEWAAITAITAGLLSIADRFGLVPKFGKQPASV